MDRLSANRAVAAVPARPAGAYRVDFWFEPTVAGEAVALGSLAAARPQLSESTPGGSDPIRLSLLASATNGGQVKNAMEALAFDPPPVETGIPAPIPIGLAVISGLVMLAGSRRFPKFFGRDEQPEEFAAHGVLEAWSRQRKLESKKQPKRIPDARVSEFDSGAEVTSSLEAPERMQETQETGQSTGLSSLLDAKRSRDRGRQ
jgi:hypothetical protein